MIFKLTNYCMYMYAPLYVILIFIIYLLFCLLVTPPAYLNILWKHILTIDSLNSDGQQFLHYKQNKQQPLTSSDYTKTPHIKC